ncbi:hypothetical protein CKAH01_02424 [Colletotrichum kahawae]|uniref:Uncharacterized protein n=1 Tax=Colletotrichum kahawae TaxID=34407 RepID=A0AAD9XYE8_COLKA|nr:hypothetical protein CKAH01_02424 [Colletotrichum kahawae]
MDDSEKHRWHGHTDLGIDEPFPVELEACQVTFVAVNLDLSNRGPKLELQLVNPQTSSRLKVAHPAVTQPPTMPSAHTPHTPVNTHSRTSACKPARRTHAIGQDKL